MEYNGQFTLCRDASIACTPSLVRKGDGLQWEMLGDMLARAQTMRDAFPDSTIHFHFNNFTESWEPDVPFDAFQEQAVASVGNLESAMISHRDIEAMLDNPLSYMEGLVLLQSYHEHQHHIQQSGGVGFNGSLDMNNEHAIASFYGGADLYDSYQEVANLSRFLEDRTITYQFNHWHFTAEPGVTVDDLEHQRQEQDRLAKEEREAWLQTDEGQKWQAEQEQAREEHMALLDAAREGNKEREANSAYQFTSEMREISGFGGEYEKACRSMVIAGLTYWDAHPALAPEFRGYEGIYGVLEETNPDGEALSEAVLEACPDASGAMHQATISHVMRAHSIGWEAYVEEMSRPREQAQTETQEQAIHLTENEAAGPSAPLDKVAGTIHALVSEIAGKGGDRAA